MIEILYIKLFKFLFWFFLSAFLYYKYKNISKNNQLLASIKFFFQNLEKLINSNLNFIDLFIIIFIINYLISFIFTNIFINILNDINLDYKFSLNYAGYPSTHNTLTTGIYNNAADVFIMTAANFAGAYLAKKTHNFAAKLCALAGGVFICGLGIVTKNVLDYISKDIGKKNFSFDYSEFLYDFFNMTGNNGLDLLIIINYYHKLIFFIITLLIYSIIVYILPENLIDNWQNILNKIFPIKVVNIYIKSFKLLKKSSLFIIICLFIMLIICSWNSYYYLNFYIENYEEIINTYFINKK